MGARLAARATLLERRTVVKRLLERLSDVVHLEANVLQALAVSGDVLREAALGIGRLAELDLDLAEREVRLARLPLIPLDASRLRDSEAALVRVDRCVDVGDRD